jgi:hypothetical protein
MNRITNKQLEAVCERINRATGSPLTPWTRGDDGRLHANIGNYHISGAYGGVQLHRMYNDGGGVEDVFRTGYGTKRELFNQMQAFLVGVEAMK